MPTRKADAKKSKAPSHDTPILQLRNLGPACEKDFSAVEIYTLGDLLELGVEKSFEVLMLGKIARGNRGKCFNAAYLYAIYGAIHNIDWRDVPEPKKVYFKKLTAKLREEYAK